MKRILIVSNMYPSQSNPNYGIFVYNAVVSLESAGISVDKIVIDKLRRNVVLKLLSYLTFYFSIIIRCMFTKYEYIYIHYVSHCGIPFLILKLFGFKFSLISHVHGGDVVYHKGRNKLFFYLKTLIAQSVLNMSKEIVFPSNSFAREVVSRFNLDNACYLVYPSGGVDERNFRIRNDITHREKIIGYAGRLLRMKNVDKIISSLLYLDESVKLEIVGDGSEKSNLVSVIDSLGLSNRVIILPFKNHIELAEWYSSIDILVYPSDSESLGLVPLEAMCCGTLTVLSSIPTFLELRDFDIYTRYIKKCDERHIANEIQYLLSMSPGVKADLRMLNSKKVIDKYSSEIVNRDLIDVFER
ncbi:MULTISPECIES: glycosyltransferase family 4 protein [Shewanella]|uniref:glycosyltransferase family 4 protein n=1 Tax=Shewanella TaxID=22 RepID=UPI00048E38FE|nr:MULTISPECIES: glycosyltransferase family 4 protein [Shewanella]MDL2195596.1 glycosyltransferase family 4 protein [Shewanella algae]